MIENLDNLISTRQNPFNDQIDFYLTTDFDHELQNNLPKSEKK